MHVSEVTNGVWAGECDTGWQADYLDFTALDNAVLIVGIVPCHSDSNMAAACCPDYSRCQCGSMRSLLTDLLGTA